ncbi:MAG: di/tripeptidase [Verrucomicrobiales bacterium]|jgi:di/tripeptidase
MMACFVRLAFKIEHLLSNHTMTTKKSTAKKKVAKKASKAALGAKKVAKKKTTTSKGVTKGKKAAPRVNKSSTTANSKLTPEQLFVETQELAYFLAEKDGFRRNPTHYWLDAKAEVEKKS